MKKFHAFGSNNYKKKPKLTALSATVTKTFSKNCKQTIDSARFNLQFNELARTRRVIQEDRIEIITSRGRE